MKQKNKLKILYSYGPACLKNAVGVPIFVKTIFEELQKSQQLSLVRTGCFLQYLPKKPSRFYNYVSLFYTKIFIPLKLIVGRYDYYIETEYFFIPLWKPKKTKIITFVYDIGLVLFDHLHTKDITENWRHIFLESMKNTDIIVTISESSKNDIQKYLQNIGMNDKPIYTIYCDAKIEIPKIDRSQQVLYKYGIKDQYFLFLGTLEPRKNPLNMIKAFHYFKKNSEKTTKLVIAGAKGWLYDEVMQYIEENSLKEDVIFTGFVSEEEKYFLIKQASAFIFLSIYEGFGIPPLEALKIGTPVLVSDIPVFHELFEESVLYADPVNVADIASKMEAISSKPPFIDQTLLTRYNWEKSAKKLLDILNR